MNKFFDVINTSHTGCFIAATDKVDAYEVALKLGHVKSGAKTMPKVIGPLDMSKDSAWPSLEVLLKSEVKGRLAKKLPLLRVEEILKSLVSDKRDPKWFFIKKV